MKLHEDRETFGVLLNEIGEQTGIRTDILEKDYYLTLLLYELSARQEKVPAYFKGGTALYKAIKSIKRFSEDIDLTVETKDCSNSQGKKRLEESANAYKLLERTSDKSRETNKKGSITSVYEYVPLTAADTQDTLQRFGYVKVEATSFTVSEPYEPLQVEPLLYTKAFEEQKKTLSSLYDVRPFSIYTIKMERIFADKLLAAEFYYERNELFDVSKHLYDIAVMTKLPRIQKMLEEKEELIQMLSYKRVEEQDRIGSDLANKPFSEFSFLQSISTDKKLEHHFMEMQNIYVFDERDIIQYSELVEIIEGLNEILQALDEKLELKIEQNFIM